MKAKNQTHHDTSEIDYNRPVELVAGPECGSMVQWPNGEMRASVKYHGGAATYVFEGNQKAIYAEG